MLLHKKQTVEQGELSESKFALKCFEDYGYMVSKPNRTADYDLVVDVNGSLKKVQVKSSIKGDGNFNICKGTNGHSKLKKYPYPEESLDSFAIHNIPKDDWYIIPRGATGDAMSLRIALKRVGKYSRYKNNWEFNNVVT